MPTYHSGMTCPICEEGALHEVIQDETFEYKGEKITFPSIKSFVCSACEEGFFDPKIKSSMEKQLTDERRKIDGLLTSSEIKKIREMFGRTQKEFAELFGVGEKNFARYENGQSTQSRGIDAALRMLRDRPENIFSLGGSKPANINKQRRAPLRIQINIYGSASQKLEEHDQVRIPYYGKMLNTVCEIRQ